jgi:hypothetical protein
MKQLFGALLVVGMLSGCIVRTHGNARGRNEPRRMSKSCPPAYHWNGYQCVHNGNGRGNGRGRGR